MLRLSLSTRGASTSWWSASPAVEAASGAAVGSTRASGGSWGRAAGMAEPEAHSRLV